MLVKIIIRLVLAIILASIGNVLARSNVPPNAPIQLPEYTGIIATFVSAIIGFFLPDLITVVARMGVARLAEDIAERLLSQLPSLPNITQSRLPLPVRSKNQAKLASKFSNPLILDTSAIIDGRLAEIVETGFLTGTLLLTPAVLAELRYIADSADTLKRARGRRGLEILEKLRKSKNVKVEVLKTEPDGKDVDDKLLKIAKVFKAKIITTDFNLNKVAAVSGVKVLNVNELANAVKTVALPGEEMKVKIIHKGKEKDQGIGYLPDGTMIVVEQGAALVGKTVSVKVARILQTVAGRMVFVKPI